MDWISVRDRLPGLFEPVLLYMPEERPFPRVREGYLSPTGWVCLLYGRDPGEITHWMPMPEGPEEWPDEA